MIQRALELERFTARELMVSRTEMVTVASSVTPEQLVATVKEHQHSRYPVCDDNLDNIVGVLVAKRALAAISTHGGPSRPFNVRTLLSLPVFVPHTMPAYRLLAELQAHHTHLAIVVNEYGATAGLVTIRDLLARITGDLPDEGEISTPVVEWLPDGTARLDGLALLIDVERHCRIRFGKTGHDTLGGFVFGQIGRRPQIGDIVEVDGCQLRVEAVDGIRVTEVHLELRPGGLLDDGSIVAGGFR